jgi:chromosome segregation protein
LPEDAAAVEAGLGIFLLALVGDEPSARQALGLAGDVAEVVCWPVPDEPVVANPPEGCRPVATTLVGEATALSVVARAARLVCLARDRQAAVGWLARLPDGRAVLPDGTVLGTGLEITPARSEGELRAVEQLRQAQRTVERQRAELTRAGERLARARETHLQQQELVDQLRQQAAAAHSAAAAGQVEEQRQLSAADRAVQTMAGLQRELEIREQQSGRDAAALAALGEELRGLEEALAAAGDQVDAVSLAVADSEQLAEAASQRLEEARLASASWEAEARIEARRSEELTSRREQLLARVRSAEDRIEAAEGAALAALHQLGTARRQAAAAQEEFERSERRRAQALADSPDPLQGLGELERTRAELEASVRAASDLVDSLERDRAAQSQQVERLRAEVDGPTVAAEAEQPAVPEDPAKAAQEIARTERRLGGLGLVNELAPRQLAELLERTAGLRSAHDDCLASRLELEQVLTKLQAVSGERVGRTLGQVTKEFESVWVELFGAGRATLVPIPGENGAPGGVELQVQPHGKRVIPMPLLSGGERALTALALVLALQKVAPSPFYVFDEVDAALDEANITSFANLLQKRAETCQFLVVTHSLITMSRASMLYGVTQDGNGSSRILSVRLTSDGQSVEARDGAELEGAAQGG